METKVAFNLIGPGFHRKVPLFTICCSRGSAKGGNWGKRSSTARGRESRVLEPIQLPARPDGEENIIHRPHPLPPLEWISMPEIAQPQGRVQKPFLIS